MFLDGSEHGGPSKARGESEDVAEVGVELDDSHRGVADVVAFVESGLKLILQQAQQTAFSCAAFSCNYAYASGLYQQLCRGQVSLDRGEGEEFIGRDFFAER